ncbi:MAG TPA: bifunctional glutamate N-acetyltransferase/amino-acid acetyltransferase ArgJ [Hypericibacter adhaerens]|jgi:glutamate N-acetyltransferase/amino-acid N-acetyltransferase|uniref:bifunctional glutamate N-acetyltransferase/amino-acid acetyltransferase ArgJ n=1 Tax=Hypericibacter adhaerens TaxID=2602016 RepID=UPI002C127755|nr:bifunctional glutamate N-acetyltransferase/amino-acid acetyltransferase ArgJ [Hypericibacter adhaerens]HWA43033.1 bifunctional glutamate N-acetyltransferase/amino-acid acetyltransferase ArgJ [Hypericibacter adhaerens]
MPERSPLAPAQTPTLPPIAGVRLAAAACEIRYKGRRDATLLEFAPGSTVAGVFTRSLAPSAPVDLCRKHLKGKTARAILVNSGNANAFTGKLGKAACDASAKAVAATLGCKLGEVFLASTGVIGEPLPAEKLVAGLPGLHRDLAEDHWADAAAAIMTTDTFPKLATRQAKIGGVTVTINGIAKGSGMIAPDMATMLAFVATDAKIPAPALQKLLSDGNARSFNCVTVDGDTSTSDTLLLVATGQAKHKPVRTAADPALKAFRAALDDLLIDLAVQVARDGEGATRLMTIDVTGAVSDKSAHRVALAIGNSPLVKTAVAGADANWGRIVMAVGKAGERAERDKLKIAIGGVTVAAKGQRVVGYDEAPVAAHMKGREVSIAVDLGLGRGKARVWSCDLTHGYIAINGDYRS